jgi:hypothetical protein
MSRLFEEGAAGVPEKWETGATLLTRLLDRANDVVEAIRVYRRGSSNEGCMRYAQVAACCQGRRRTRLVWRWSDVNEEEEEDREDEEDEEDEEGGTDAADAAKEEVVME